MGLPLRLHEGAFGMVKLPAAAEIPPGLTTGTPIFIARTAAELSCIGPIDLVRSAERFRLVEIAQTFGTTEFGILKQLLDPLAAAEVWVLALGTHDTDYMLLRDDQTVPAVAALKAAGHSITQ
jgi:hypothetical protein